MSTRLTVNINDETADALRTLAEERGESITETVRRAVGVHKFFHEAQAAGKQVRLRDRSGAVEIVGTIA